MSNRGGSRLRGARAVIIVAVLAVLGLTSVGPPAAEADTIATLVNQARAGAELPALTHDPAMDSVALQWARPTAQAPARAPSPELQAYTVSASKSSSGAFPIGYVVGGVLMLLGLAGGIYGQMLRRRGRRPPGS
jgi:hypothetical protein